MTSFLLAAAMLLRPETGWVWLNHQLAFNLDPKAQKACLGFDPVGMDPDDLSEPWLCRIVNMGQSIAQGGFVSKFLCFATKNYINTEQVLKESLKRVAWEQILELCALSKCHGTGGLAQQWASTITVSYLPLMAANWL